MALSPVPHDGRELRRRRIVIPSRMLRTRQAVMGALVLGLVAAPAALAAFPATGTIVEGKSVPGVAFGSTRSHAYKTWGSPSFCQSTGQGFCTWQRQNGAVDLTFQAPGGGMPTGKGSDVVGNADYSGLPGWRTTTGVTTTNALNDPASVPPKYPGAEVAYYGDGHLRYVYVPHRGIGFYWIPQTYSNTFYVFIEVFPPRAS